MPAGHIYGDLRCRNQGFGSSNQHHDRAARQLHQRDPSRMLESVAYRRPFSRTLSQFSLLSKTELAYSVFHVHIGVPQEQNFRHVCMSLICRYCQRRPSILAGHISLVTRTHIPMQQNHLPLSSGSPPLHPDPVISGIPGHYHGKRLCATKLKSSPLGDLWVSQCNSRHCSDFSRLTPIFVCYPLL